MRNRCNQAGLARRDHLPIYYQHQIYLREGIEITQSTMTGWAGQCSRLLQP
ncbi:MAG: hypothetical protein EB127_20935, partial [Alphaproteobacteria bacterium]|nr:hypothetical protein [Alphaproteobacteria bacterium]